MAATGSQTPLADQQQLEGLSDVVQARFRALSAAVAPDCRIRSSDGAEFPVHKLKLMETSSVLRQVPCSLPWLHRVISCVQQLTLSCRPPASNTLF